MHTRKLWVQYLVIVFLISISHGKLYSQENLEQLLYKEDSVLFTFLSTPNFINSSWSETTPLLNATEQMLIFNRYSRRARKDIHQIFVTKKTLGKWGNVQDISSFFASKKNMHVTDLSPDGQTIILCGGKKGKKDLYYSRLQGTKWSKPTEFEKPINSKWNETDASLSHDERLLVFSSNRPGGYGGYDLYIAQRLENGNWGEPQNMGANVNSVRDEITPSLHTDGKTLFFSSEKRGGFGKMDIYFSLYKDSLWQASKNLGEKINTKNDDTNFKMGINKKSAWWASRKINGYFDLKLLQINITNRIPRQVVYSGMVYMEDYKPTDNVEITISDAESKELVGEYRPNPVTGEYIYILEPKRTYNILLTAPGYLGYTHDFFVPVDSSYQVIHRSIALHPIKFYTPPVQVIEGEEFTTVKDILFGVNDSETIKYNKNLNKLAEHLIDNASCIIEIGGHTDESGDAIYNRSLSLKRAQNVSDYLINQGVSKESFIIRNYGPNVPIARNNDFKAQRYNRRVEFRILKQGNVKLMIQRIQVPDNYKSNPKSEK